jgi:NAD(P)H-flavin reductase/ferredoxin
MAVVQFEDAVYALRPGETLLDGLERGGAQVPSSCRNGVCQSCLMRAEAGAPPAASQKGLGETQVAQGYFLACQCVPGEDLSVARPDDAGRMLETRVVALVRLNARVWSLRLACPAGFSYRPGQFINLMRDGVVRSYSLASVPGLDDTLACHVMHYPGGSMSGWICTEACPGDSLKIAGPLGSCFYTPGRPGQPLLLMGTGTGLAPLYGILRDALQQGHTGPIHLFHGSLRADGLYLVDELRALARTHPQVAYYPCSLEESGDPEIHAGDLGAYAKARIGDLGGWRVFLCGAPDFVKQSQRACFLAGANMADILADAFLPAAQPAAAQP